MNQWNAAMRNGMRSGRDHTGLQHIRTNLPNDRTALERAIERIERLCSDDIDDDDFRGGLSAARAALSLPVMQGPARYPSKADIPAVSPEQVENAGWFAAAAATTYWIISGLSRLYLPRNFVPIP